MNLAEAQALRYGAQKVKVYPDWIPTSQNPDKSGVYIICDGHDVLMALFIGGKWMRNFDEPYDGITHWMPLPPAPTL